MRRALFLSLAVPLLATRLSADTLEGLVTAPDGQPLPQALLKVSSASETRSVMSGAAGRYRVADLPAGTYTVTSGMSGFLVRDAGEVRVAGIARLDVTLAPAPVREHVVVAAARGEAPSSSVGVSTTVFDADRIDAREATSLVQLLQDAPGVAVNRSGPVGREATVFVRGGGSNQTKVIVDGVPVNEPGGFFEFGAELGVGVDQVEVVRGAASSLYGSDALAGVIEMHAHRPVPGEPIQASLSAEAGSYSFQRYRGGTSGQRGAFDWNVAAQRITTDNDGPNAGFHQNAGSVSLGAQMGGGWSLQAVGRLDDGRTGTPGQTLFGQHDDSYFDRTDVLASVRALDTFRRGTHELRAGYEHSAQLSVDPTDSGSYTPTFGDLVAPYPAADYPDPLGYQNNTGRTVAGYKLEYQLTARHLVTGGTDLEHEAGDLGDRGQPMLSPTRTNFGVYLQDRWAASDVLFVTVGGRVEHNDSFGTAAVPRAAVAWRVRDEGGASTLLRASAGAGIKEPGFFESFGTSIYAMGNPDLKPERSRTYDAGVEQRAFHNRARLAVTGYRQEYLDQIAYTSDPVTFQGTWVNLGQTRAQGIEVEAEAAPVGALRLVGQYTYLDSTIVVASGSSDPTLAVGQPLLRRPGHTASFTAQVQPTSALWTAAATLVYVGSRADSDFSGLGLTRNDAYTRLDARLRARVHRSLELFAIGENLADATYQELLGYPALGRSLRIGLTARAGR